MAFHRVTILRREERLFFTFLKAQIYVKVNNACRWRIQRNSLTGKILRADRVKQMWFKTSRDIMLRIVYDVYPDTSIGNTII